MTIARMDCEQSHIYIYICLRYPLHKNWVITQKTTDLKNWILRTRTVCRIRSSNSSVCAW
jgi:hypothetical protein